MFELSIAKKYLIPRKRQLSVSIIAIISILVISLVVWLILLFLSITDGMERSWVEKLITLNAPVQVTPTEAYYQSYYYQVDTVSAASEYRLKSLEEKLHAERSDPYDSDIDPELPLFWAPPDRDQKGKLRDPVKGLLNSLKRISSVPGLEATSFEMAFTQLKVRLLRNHLNNASFRSTPSQKIQSSFLAISSFTGSNRSLQETLIPPSSKDLTNLLFLLSVSSSNIQEDVPDEDASVERDIFQSQLRHFLPYIHIESLEAGEEEWSFPTHLLPDTGEYHAEVCVLYQNDGQVWKCYLPKDKGDLSTLLEEAKSQGYRAAIQTLSLKNSKLFLKNNELSPTHLYLPTGEQIPATLLDASIPEAIQASELRFRVKGTLQGIPYQGEIPYGTLSLGKVSLTNHFPKTPDFSPLWIYRVANRAYIPSDPEVGEGILLSQRFKENGVLLGDRGHLTYSSVTTSGMQEQRIPVYVAGFYDTGVLPVGNKLVLANPQLTTLIRSSVEQHQQGDTGFNIWFDDFHQADAVKSQLIASLKENGIERYWKVETYKDYDFSKTLVQQFQSDRNVLSLIAIIIILIACSNIISMLIILVNDKKKEIGILLSMGASPKSMALIFGICGLVMGITGSLIGVLAAFFTLQNLDFLVDIISTIQGYEVFHSTFYGHSLPSELSIDAVVLVCIATFVLSLISGIIPAIKASLLRPYDILRSE